MSSSAFIRLLALTFFQSYHNIRFNLFRCYSFLCQLFQIFMLLFFRFSHFHVSRYLAFQVLYFFNIYVLMLMGFKFLDSPIIRFMVFSSRIFWGGLGPMLLGFYGFQLFPIFSSAFALWANAELYILVPSLTPFLPSFLPFLLSSFLWQKVENICQY